MKLREEVKDILGVVLFVGMIVIGSLALSFKSEQINAQKNTAGVPVQAVNINR